MTHYHSKYYANFLTLQNPNNWVERLGNSIFNATIDLNPHQVDAALFFFQNPLANWVILADEVWLGKTIEWGIVLSQLRSEHKRKILLIVPASLRKQWSSELEEKFHLPSVILDNKTYKDIEKKGSEPFHPHPHKIVICSYEFVAKRSMEIASTPWDLVVIDEAHKLRNVYRTDNKRANEIKGAIATCKKLLLTATPLQNSLLELYGLVSFIDEQTFGDLNSFKAQFVWTDGNNADLKQRLRPLIHRTLRRQVLEYVPYTNRIAIVEKFTPSPNEQKLYDYVSDFLQRDNLKSINNSQRQLITLIFRKLLASSSRAIEKTLDTLITRLESKYSFEELIDDEDLLAEVQEEYSDEMEDQEQDKEAMKVFLKELKKEIEELKEFKKLASTISVDEKTKALMIALRVSFSKLATLGVKEKPAKKAIIFTESRRTQEYLKEYLEAHGYKGKILLFNGTNKSPESKLINQNWLKKYEWTSKITWSKESDMRASLVEHFKEDPDCELMIATESAAEWVNLQFCSLLINYDLPWNPQRIEQRIGRCHRYGQKFDVLVVNFINTNNKADQRVFELLNEKFKLFEWVFGASDEVLGAIEDGKDFEKRILEIYQSCRTDKEIEEAFNALQQQLDESISQRMDETTQKVFENFDEDVARNLKIKKEQSTLKLDIFKDYFWRLTHIELQNKAEFDEKMYAFKLHSEIEESIPIWWYNLVPNKEDVGYTYRTNEGLGEHIINDAKRRQLPVKEIIFDHSNNPHTVSALKSFKGKSWWLSVEKLALQSFDAEEYLILNGFTDDGVKVEQEILQKLFSVQATEWKEIVIDDTTETSLNTVKEESLKQISQDSLQRNNEYFDKTIEKLDKWAEDKIVSLEREIKDIRKQIATLKTESRKIVDLQQKISIQKDIKNLEAKQNKLKREKFDEEDKIINEKDKLIDTLQAKLSGSSDIENLFVIRWKVI